MADAIENYNEGSIQQNSLRLVRNNEEMIVPAHNLKKPIDFNTVSDKDFGDNMNGKV